MYYGALGQGSPHCGLSVEGPFLGEGTCAARIQEALFRVEGARAYDVQGPYLKELTRQALEAAGYPSRRYPAPPPQPHPMTGEYIGPQTDWCEKYRNEEIMPYCDIAVAEILGEAAPRSPTDSDRRTDRSSSIEDARAGAETAARAYGAWKTNVAKLHEAGYDLAEAESIASEGQEATDAALEEVERLRSKQNGDGFPWLLLGVGVAVFGVGSYMYWRS